MSGVRKVDLAQGYPYQARPKSIVRTIGPDVSSELKRAPLSKSEHM